MLHKQGLGLTIVGGLAALTIAAAACGDDQEPSATPVSAAPTRLPTASPSPTEVPSTTDLELTQTQVIKGLGFSIDYPAFWSAGTKDDVTAIHERVVDHEDFLRESPPPTGAAQPPPGAGGPAGYSIEFQHAPLSFLRSAGLPEDATLDDLLFLNSNRFRWRVMEKAETTVFGTPALRLLLGTPDPDGIAVIGFSGDRAFMLEFRAPSEDALRGFVPVLEKMLASTKAAEEPSLPPEQQYFTEAREARALTAAQLGAFGTIFSQSYQTRELLIGALLRAGVGTAFVDSVEALEKIPPPDRLVSDHRTLLDGYRELARLDLEAQRAIEDGEVAEFVLTNGRLGDVSAGIPLRLSAEFCHEVLRDSTSLCDPLEPLPGGAYGSQLFEAMRLLEVDLAGPGGALGFPLSLSDEEALVVFNEVASGAATAVRQTQARVESLSSPAELSSDHDLLVDFLGNLAEIYDSVATSAATSDADGARAEVPRVQELKCEAFRAFSSEEFWVLVGPFIICQEPPFGR